MTEESETRTPPENPPRRVLEDWEMLQSQEDPPLKVPKWFVAIVVGLLISSVLLTMPFMRQRIGFERPWFDWGLLAGVGYGVVFLVIIYFFMGGGKSASDKSEHETKK